MALTVGEMLAAMKMAKELERLTDAELEERGLACVPAGARERPVSEPTPRPTERRLHCQPYRRVPPWR